MPQWMAMLMIFEYTTWILFCLIFLLSAAAWYFYGRVTRENPTHKNVALCALNSWAVFLGVAANNRPYLSPLRIFFIALSLYGMNVTTIYTSKLIRVFTHPALEDQIDTIEEVIDSHLPIGEFDISNKFTFNWFFFFAFDCEKIRNTSFIIQNV